jgi:hypothetical protein
MGHEMFKGEICQMKCEHRKTAKGVMYEVSHPYPRKAVILMDNHAP